VDISCCFRSQTWQLQRNSPNLAKRTADLVYFHRHSQLTLPNHLKQLRDQAHFTIYLELSTQFCKVSHTVDITVNGYVGTIPIAIMNVSL